MPHYNPSVIEPRWQAFWEQNKTFRCPEPNDPSVTGKPKMYILDMFPYPSGSGLHVGHPEGYTATDILCRYKRMQGFHVLHPMGWDAFGLPAEQHAIQTGEHPSINTQNNINTFRRQIKSLGFSYDWDREVDTTDPSYVKWTQWIFLVLHDTWYDHQTDKGRPISELPIPEGIKKQSSNAIRQYQDSKRLAYQAETPVNWCPALGTVLANEEVIDGKSERGNHPVVRMPIRQWSLRITEYAERLLNDLDPLDWSESIKMMQRNWIGKSIGAEVDFLVDMKQVEAEWLISGGGSNAGGPDTLPLRIFTTRPDTLFGATYMVLSPEHPLVKQITTPDQIQAVKEYQEAAAMKSDFERTEIAKTKTGVFTGAYAINPVNQEKIPIWIADYVLASYGTGAIMAVPAHDERDFEFATQFGLPIRTVVRPPEEWLKKTKSTLAELKEPYCEEGIAIHSGDFSNLPSAEFKKKIIDWLESKQLGKGKVNYKLRDWLFSRQRYWGEPFPLLHELDEKGNPTGIVRPLSVDDLPVRLPDMEDFKPTGSPEGPLAKAQEWMNVTIDGKKYRRETNTMPQWAGSCWYYLRYLDPKNDKVFCEPRKLKYWLPVDLYVGGAEHAVLHLLYSRFWHKVLYDRGYIPCKEPFQRLVNQGMILGENEYRVSPGNYEQNKPTFDEKKLIASHFKSDEEEYYVVKVPGEGNSNPKNLPDDQVEKRKGKAYLAGTQIELMSKADKMSKSRGNVINPDDVVKEYGADSLRLYEMFMGPLEATKPWSMKSVEGVYRFLSRVWRLIVDEASEKPVLASTVVDLEPDQETKRILHRTIQKVSEDTEALRFNTAIAAMMELSNHLTGLKARPKEVLETLVLLLSAYAPHISEELWNVLGHDVSCAYEPWPKYDPALTVADEIEIPIQVNGKVKSKITVPAEMDDKTLELTALADAKVVEQIAGKTVKMVKVVPKRLVNIVVTG